MDKGKQAKKNKQRSRTQEQQIARYFAGNRVPMSGAGNIKGDVLIPYDTYRTIYVECKLTEKDAYYIPKSLFNEIETNAQNGRCICGFLVIKYLHKGSLVILRALDGKWFQIPYPSMKDAIEYPATIEYQKHYSAGIIRDRLYHIYPLEMFKAVYDTITGSFDQSEVQSTD